MHPQEVQQRLTNALLHAGLDIVCPFQLSWYNAALPEELGARIPVRGSAGGAALCILIANSKAIWEPFLEACSQNPSLLALNDPLDAYITSTIEHTLEQCTPSLRHRLFYSHQRTSELEGSSEFVAFQRMAHAAGLAHLDATCHLSIHPRYGTWLSLRACVVFDDVVLEGVTQPPPPSNPLALDPATRRYVQLTMQSAVHSTSRRWQLDEAEVEAAAATLLDTGNDEAHSSDEAACSSQMAGDINNMAGLSPGCSRRSSLDTPAWAMPSMHAIRQEWKRWVAVRDAPCPGHFWRYPEDMINYHYTANKEYLVAALKQRGMLPAPASPERRAEAFAGMGV